MISKLQLAVDFQTFVGSCSLSEIEVLLATLHREMICRRYPGSAHLFNARDALLEYRRELSTNHARRG